MGDISAEPSMEDILSSIKRIIAEEGEGVATRTRRPAPRTIARAEPIDDDEVLELREPLRAEPEPKPAAPPPAAREPETEPEPAEAAAGPILSDRTAEASRAPLDTLSRLLVKPDVSGSDTLEGLVRELLRPMLGQWLDRHLPEIVETLVAREIARLTDPPR